MKINCDASVRGKGFIGIDFVIRNNDGKVTGAGVNRIQGNMDVDSAEAFAVRSALRLSRDFAFSKVIVESDRSR